MDNKKIGVIVGSIVLVCLVVFGVLAGISYMRIKHNNDNYEQGNNIVNNSGENLTELPTTYIEGEKVLGDLVFKNVKIVLEDENKCVLKSDVVNNSEEVVNASVVRVELITGSGESIGTLEIGVPEMNSGDTAEVSMDIGVDVMHTRDINVMKAE